METTKATTMKCPCCNQDTTKVTTFIKEITYRPMTLEEVSVKCKDIGLSPEVTEFILGEFKDAQKYIDDPDDHLSCDELGRLCYGMFWDNIFDRLGDAMGIPGSGEGDDDLYKKIDQVFDVFFAE